MNQPIDSSTFDAIKMFPDENAQSMEKRIEELETDNEDHRKRETRHLHRISNLEEMVADDNTLREKIESLQGDVTRWMTKLLDTGKLMGLKDFDENDIFEAARRYREIMTLLGGEDVNPLEEITKLRADLVKALAKP